MFYNDTKHEEATVVGTASVLLLSPRAAA